MDAETKRRLNIQKQSHIDEITTLRGELTTLSTPFYNAVYNQTKIDAIENQIQCLRNKVARILATFLEYECFT